MREFNVYLYVWGDRGRKKTNEDITVHKHMFKKKKQYTHTHTQTRKKIIIATSTV